MQKRVSNKSRHISWNWEQSPDNESLVRYHFVVIDDKDREGKINGVLESLTRINSGVEKIREVEGKVVGTDYRYLFGSYDSRTSPDFLDFGNINKKRDKDLRERLRGSIEDYVANKYSK